MEKSRLWIATMVLLGVSNQCAKVCNKYAEVSNQCAKVSNQKGSFQQTCRSVQPIR